MSMVEVKVIEQEMAIAIEEIDAQGDVHTFTIAS